LAAALTVPIILIAPFLLTTGVKSKRSSSFSTQKVLGYLLLVAFVSNLSYLSSEIQNSFQHWQRLLFPISVITMAAYIFRRDETQIDAFILAYLLVFALSCYKTFDASAMIELQQGVKRQTNWGNAVAAASPFIFLINHRYVRNAFLFIAIAVLIASLKRSGILSALVLSLTFVWHSVKFSNLSTRVSRRALISIPFGLAIVAIAAQKLVNNGTFSDYLLRAQVRILAAQDDGGSGRFDLWSSAIEIHRDAGVFQVIFGHGFGWFHDNYLRLGFGIESLHNDPIDFLISFGVLGAFIYLMLAARIIWLAVFYAGSKRDSAFALSTALTLVIYSMFSGIFFYSSFFVPLFIAVGYLEGRLATQRSIKLNQHIETPLGSRHK